MQINPYINFNGNAQEAFEFYRAVFGGEFSKVIRMKDTSNTNNHYGEEDHIMHIVLPINNHQMLMARDNCIASHNKGNSQSIFIQAESREEGQRLYDALIEGGKANHPYRRETWGAWQGHLVHKFGVRWVINFDENQSTL